MAEKQGFSTVDIAYIAVFAALLAACSWISVPTTIPFTLQTLGVCLTVGLLGGKRGTMAILLYLLLAAMGVPVLAGFTGGAGILLGETGGYLLGFLLTGLTMWLLEKLLGRRLWVQAIGMVLGLALCYLFGTLWYMAVYLRTGEPVGFWVAMSWCVFPFLLPDLVKVALALLLTERLRKYVR